MWFSQLLYFWALQHLIWYLFNIFHVFFEVLCSFILLPSSVSIFIIITFNSLSGKLIFLSLRFFWVLYSFLEHILSVSSFCLILCFNFYMVDETTTSSSPEGVASYRRQTLLFNSALNSWLSFKSLCLSKQPTTVLITPSNWRHATTCQHPKGENLSSLIQAD